MAGHSSSNFVCRICKDVFANQTFLDQHFSDLHPTKTSHHCVICNEDFISELFLQIHRAEYHRKSHTTLSEQGARSLVETKSPRKNKSINSKRFNNSGYLQKIVSNTHAHTNDNVFWCPVCFESYSKRENLRDHLRSSHILGSDSVYVCELCNIEKPSAEMLCWHLEVHSNNRLSVNRFSKLRTCVSSIKKEESGSESTFHTSVTNEDTSKAKTKLNNLKSEINTSNNSTREIRFKNDGVEKHSNMGLCKENTIQKRSSGRLTLSIIRSKRGLHSQLKIKSFRKSKLNRLASKKLLLQNYITNTPHMLKDDGDKTVKNNNSEVIRGSITKLGTKTAKDSYKKNRKKQYKTENGILNKSFTNDEPSDLDEYRDDGTSDGLNDASRLTLNQSLCENDRSLEVQSTNNTTVTQSIKGLVDHETIEKISQNEADAHLTCKDDPQSPFVPKIIEFSLNPDKNNEDVSSDLINKSIPETTFDSSEKQYKFIKSSLSQKGKSRFRNLRSSGPNKHEKLYIINTKKTKRTLMNNTDSNLKCDNQDSKKRTMFNTELNLTAEEESPLVAIGNAESYLQPNNIEGSSQCEMRIKSQSAKNDNKEISIKTPVNISEDSVKKKEYPNIPSNVMENSEFEVPIITNNGNSRDNELSSKLPPDDYKIKTQETCGSSYKDSTTFHCKDEERSKKELNLKLILRNSSSKTYSKVANTLTNFEFNSSENNVLCDAKDVVSQITIKKIVSEKTSKNRYMKKSGKSSICDDLKGTVSGKPVSSESEKNSQSVSNIFENSLEKQNDKPIDGGSTISIRVETKNSSSKSDDYQITEDSPNESNELFEEVSCDKCSLKFYNQDDLFDHIGSHYDI